jgi:hypothetical protein
MMWQIVEYRMVQVKPCLVENWLEAQRWGVVSDPMTQSEAVGRAQRMNDAEADDERYWVAERIT